MFFFHICMDTTCMFDIQEGQKGVPGSLKRELWVTVRNHMDSENQGTPVRAPSDFNLWDNCQNPGLSTFNEKKLEGFRGSYICYLLLFLHVSALVKNRRGSLKILDSGQNSHKIIIISLNFCPQGGLTWKEGNSTVSPISTKCSIMISWLLSSERCFSIGLSLFLVCSTLQPHTSGPHQTSAPEGLIPRYCLFLIFPKNKYPAQVA